MDDTSNKRLEAGRVNLRQSLDQIEADIEATMRDANLCYPVRVCVPRSGDSLAAMMTPAEPPSDDWEKATKIFLKIIADHLGESRLRSRDRKLSHECRLRS
jgi:hypothetical protein